MKLIEENGETLIALTKDEFRKLAEPYVHLYEQADAQHKNAVLDAELALKQAQIQLEEQKAKTTFLARLTGLINK